MTVGAIRSPEKYVKAALRRRTERFDDCFPRGISLGDIDSFVEINRHFLFVEWKLGDQALKGGQMMALERLSKVPRVSVFIVWTTEDGFITHGQRLGIHRVRVATDEETVKQRLREWSMQADAAPANRIADAAIADHLEALVEIDAIRTKALLMLIAGLRAP